MRAESGCGWLPGGFGGGGYVDITTGWQVHITQLCFAGIKVAVMGGKPLLRPV